MNGPDTLEADSGFAEKVAIIAGGGALDDGVGNGRAAAILLARAGSKVVVVDRILALAQRTVEMIMKAGGSAVAHQADLTDEPLITSAAWTSLTTTSVFRVAVQLWTRHQKLGAASCR
jgi:NAD(P)-dependent dehydrogenase (short-subunit alcohol dehydrogenase family)